MITMEIMTAELPFFLNGSKNRYLSEWCKELQVPSTIYVTQRLILLAFLRRLLTHSDAYVGSQWACLEWCTNDRANKISVFRSMVVTFFYRRCSIRY